DAGPGIEISALAAGTSTIVVVVAAQLDGAGGGVAVDDELHHRSGHLEIAVLLVLGRIEDAGGRTDDQFIIVRIHRTRIRILVEEVRRLGERASLSAGGSQRA